MTSVPGPLPHAKEVKVQIGGMLGLQKLLHPQIRDEELAHNIHGLAEAAVAPFTGAPTLPFSIR